MPNVHLQIVERSQGEPYVLAHVDNIVGDDPIYTTLGAGDNRWALLAYLKSHRCSAAVSPYWLKRAPSLKGL